VPFKFRAEMTTSMMIAVRTKLLVYVCTCTFARDLRASRNSVKSNSKFDLDLTLGWHHTMRRGASEKTSSLEHCVLRDH
jgi:hypothetical protein